MSWHRKIGVVAALTILLVFWSVSIKPETGFFMASKKPKECIYTKPTWPAYKFRSFDGREIFSYSGNLSGAWKVWLIPEENEIECYRLVGFNGMERVWKVEKEQLGQQKY